MKILVDWVLKTSLPVPLLFKYRLLSLGKILAKIFEKNKGAYKKDSNWKWFYSDVLLGHSVEKPQSFDSSNNSHSKNFSIVQIYSLLSDFRCV